MRKKASVKWFVVLFVVVSLLGSSLSISYAEDSYLEANNVKLIDSTNKVVDGKVSLVGETTNKKIKYLIKKDEESLWLDVKLEEGKFHDEVWLIYGKGVYDISIMVSEGGNSYSFGPTLTVENTVEVNRFLVPTKHVESNEKEIIDLSKSLMKGAITDRQKAEKIYNWIVKNIKYDYKKYKKQLNKDFDNDYGALNTLRTKTGVCYDYSTLYAALGRAANIQVKVIKGDFKSSTRSELHAWNEVYLEDEQKWINVDTTFGYALNKNYLDNKDFGKDHIKISEY